MQNIAWFIRYISKLNKTLINHLAVPIDVEISDKVDDLSSPNVRLHLNCKPCWAWLDQTRLNQTSDLSSCKSNEKHCGWQFQFVRRTSYQANLPSIMDRVLETSLGDSKHTIWLYWRHAVNDALVMFHNLLDDLVTKQVCVDTAEWNQISICMYFNVK